MLRDIAAETIVLENARALLRPLTEADVPHLLPFSLREPELWRFGLQAPTGDTALRSYVARALADRSAQISYPFVVFDKASGKFAGATRYYEISRENETALLGYTWYGKDFQRTGLNRHCKYLLLEFAFENWMVQRIEFRTDADNRKSREALGRIGAVQEGILRSHLPKLQGGRRDTVVFSILREEWLRTGKEMLRERLHPDVG